MFRIGNGYDVHRLVEGRKLILGGLEIPYEKGLLGHSDADVLTHAIMDALLGALALGDIGYYFPDTDEKYKGISSLVLLQKVMEEIRGRGYEIVNLDATLVLQKPKLRPYMDKIRAVLAKELGIPMEQLGLKASTEEKLGFTGREEGVKAYAVVLLKRV